MGWRKGTWEWRDREGVRWVEDSFLTETGLVRQAFLSRVGGVSSSPYDSLNIGYGSGDERQAVRENRQRAGATLRLPAGEWSCVTQIHGVSIKRVGRKDAGIGALDPEVQLTKADGQITDETGVTLATQHADCIPLYVLDPARPAIGLAHAGWKGTLSDIAGELVAAMTSAYGSDPADMLASIGPGAGPCHYEVDEPVLRMAEARFADRPADLELLLSPSLIQGRAYLDMYKANALLFERRGVPAERISLAEICTMCENSLLFSHRMKDRGRQAALFALKAKPLQ